MISSSKAIEPTNKCCQGNQKEQNEEYINNVLATSDNLSNNSEK